MKAHTSFYDFIRVGDKSAIEQSLMNGKDVNETSDKGETPLMEAAFLGKNEIAGCLIGHQADTNAATKDGDTALMGAARCGHVSIFKKIHAANGDINAQTKRSFTVLMKGVMGDNPEIVSYTAERVNDINVKNIYKETAISYARTVTVAMILIEKGAKFFDKETGKEIPFDQIKQKDTKMTSEEFSVFKKQLIEFTKKTQTLQDMKESTQTTDTSGVDLTGSIAQGGKGVDKSASRMSVRADIAMHKKAITSIQTKIELYQKTLSEHQAAVDSSLKGLQKGTKKRDALAKKLKEIRREYGAGKRAREVAAINFVVQNMRKEITR